MDLTTSQAVSTPVAAGKPVEFKLNGQTVIGRSNEPIIETARKHGITVPQLCYREGLRPDGNCRACVVEIKGERVLAPSCCRFPSDGMEVTTDSARALASQKLVIELLLADMPEQLTRPTTRSRPTRSSSRSTGRASRHATSPRPISRTRRSRSISTRASSARVACARAARSK